MTGQDLRFIPITQDPEWLLYMQQYGCRKQCSCCNGEGIHIKRALLFGVLEGTMISACDTCEGTGWVLWHSRN